MKVEKLKIPLAKVDDFEPLGALFGLGAPEAVLIDFILRGVFIDIKKNQAFDKESLKNHCNSLLK